MSKVIVITGGSDGLGKAMTKLLSPHNIVVIISKNENSLKETAEALSCDYKICDVSNYKKIKATIKQIVEKYKKIDVLINNAGIWIEGELDTNDPKNIQRVADININGTIFTTQAVVPYMKKNGKGNIINIISQAGFYGKTERSVYTASKFALTGFTKSLQMELAKYSISVTGFYPGKMKTNLFKKENIEKDLTNGLNTETVAKVIKFILSFDSTVNFPEVGIKHIIN